MDWARILAYVTGTVDQELLERNEYLAAENRIIKAQLKGRLKLSDAERGALGEIGHRLGRKVLADVATIARPDTILGWYRKLVARKFDGSKARRGPGRPRIKREVEQLIIRMASENQDWGYDRIAGALAVNRRSTLPLDRRPMLTPLIDGIWRQRSRRRSRSG
jgi:putative transposase